MTPIRETIARAILDGIARFRGDPYIDESGGLDGVMIDGMCDLHEAADSVLRALEAEGWRVVPAEPTEAMQVAGKDIGKMETRNAFLRFNFGDRHPVTAAIYRAMLAASPPPRR